MKRLTNDEILKYFVNNTHISKQTDLTNNNNTIYCYYKDNTRYLVNYNTIISKVNTKENYKKIYINNKKYSHTTSKIQNKLLRLAQQNGFEIVQTEKDL